MAHDFKSSLARARPEELRLDTYLEGMGYTVTSVSLPEERRGIDRSCTSPEGVLETFEYKSDFRASETGNAYIETVSVDKPFKDGWANTCQADWLLYHVVGDNLVLWLKPSDIRKMLGVWAEDYRTATADNGHYRGTGILVPLTELKSIAWVQEYLK